MFATTEKKLKAVAKNCTKVINKVLKAKRKGCVSRLEASEQRKTKEDKIVVVVHKDEMSKLVKSHEKELHVRIIVLWVSLARVTSLCC